MKSWIYLGFCLLVAASLCACGGARHVGAGAKTAGRGILTVFEYPSKALAGHPKDYAAMQGMSKEDQEADAAPAVDKKALKKKTKVKPSIMRPGY